MVFSACTVALVEPVVVSSYASESTVVDEYVKYLRTAMIPPFVWDAELDSFADAATILGSMYGSGNDDRNLGFKTTSAWWS